MNDWVVYAVAGMLQVGLLMALYKLPAARNINKYVLSVWGYFFGAVFAGIFLIQFITVDPQTLLFAFLWGTGFAVLALIQMRVLHDNDTSDVYPFTSLASNVLVVLGGVFFLNEIISLLQWVAISASILLFIAAHWKNRAHFVASMLPSFVAIALLSTFNKFIQKIGATNVEVHNFVFWQLVCALAASFVILLYTKKRVADEEFSQRHTLKWAILMGALLFGSGYTITKALAVGPISMVYTILGLYTFFASAFAIVLFKEKITPKAFVYVAASFLIVLLIKLG